MKFFINIDCLGTYDVENLLGVLLLCKISRNLVESKPFKTSCELIFFQIRNDFLKKSSNFN